MLVNNVGAVKPHLDGFLSVTDDQWFFSLTLNLMAAVRTTRAALPMMLAAGRGSIVTTSSVNAFLPDPSIIDYCAAKAALTNFCKALSKEVGPQGIRVNTVSPGPVQTDLWLGPDGVAETIAQAQHVDPAEVAATPRATRSPDVSPRPSRSPTWCCSWPATGPATSRAPTTSSTEGWSRRPDPGDARGGASYRMG